MATVTQDLSTARRAARSSPFLAAALCFLLPFFTASSCGSGQETTATGVDIVAGTQLVAQQTTQPMFGPATALGPVGPDPEAQAVSSAARPWAILALVLTMLGAALVIRRRWYWHGASALAAAAAFAALIELGSTLDAPQQDVTPEWGLVLAGAIMLGTALWQVCVLAVAQMRVSGTGARGPSRSPAVSSPRQ